MLQIEKRAVLWLTGFSGAGKTTIAKKFVKIVKSKLIDSDEITYIAKKKGCFTNEDRIRNQELIIKKVKRLYDKNHIVLTAFISPFRRDRELVRAAFPVNFFEIFVDTPIELCRKRDPKSLYEKFSKGKINNFVGCNVKYEIPDNPDLIIRTEEISVDDAVQKIVGFLKAKNIVEN